MRIPRGARTAGKKLIRHWLAAGSNLVPWLEPGPTAPSPSAGSPRPTGRCGCAATYAGAMLACTWPRSATPTIARKRLAASALSFSGERRQLQLQRRPPGARLLLPQAKRCLDSPTRCYLPLDNSHLANRYADRGKRPPRRFPESLWSDKNVDATRRVGPALASMLVGLI
jgi:hypothetical protein